jgi:Ran GTPase-activating protein (RanGAP) involved in mRNA processing and transport
MDQSAALSAIDDMKPALEAWPDELRATMCGMDWDDHFFDGRPDPRSVIVRNLRYDRFFTGRYGGLMIRSRTLNARDMTRLAAAKGISQLACIDLSYNPIGGVGVRELASAKHLDALRELCLSSCDLDSGALGALAHAAFFGRLRRLDVDNNKLVGDAIAPLFDAERMPDELRLGSNALGAAGAAAIAGGAGPSTKRLSLDSSDLGAEGAARLSAYPHPLEMLDLSHNAVGDEGLRALASGTLRAGSLVVSHDAISHVGIRALVEWPLVSLALGSNALDDEAARILAASAPETLASLDLKDNDITSAGLVALVMGLEGLTSLDVARCRMGAFPELPPSMRNLERLELGDNRLGDEGTQALLNVQAEHLRALCVARNRITAPALEALSGAPWFGGLRTLDVRGNPIGPAAGLLLGAAPLETLEMAHTGLGDDGLAALCKATFKPTSLDLSRCDLTDRSVELLANSPIASRLERLSLSHNAITDRGVQALVRSPHLTNVKRLFLENNRIGDAGVVALTSWQGPLQVELDDNPYGPRGEAAIKALPRRCCP